MHRVRNPHFHSNMSFLVFNRSHCNAHSCRGSAKYSTPTTRRKKNVIPEFDSLKVLTFHYTEDPAQSENERQRVQLAVLFLVHAFSAAPPWSTTNINMRRTRGPIAGR